MTTREIKTKTTLPLIHVRDHTSVQSMESAFMTDFIEARLNCWRQQNDPKTVLIEGVNIKRNMIINRKIITGTTATATADTLEMELTAHQRGMTPTVMDTTMTTETAITTEPVTTTTRTTIIRITIIIMTAGVMATRIKTKIMMIRV